MQLTCSVFALHPNLRTWACSERKTNVWSAVGGLGEHHWSLFYFSTAQLSPPSFLFTLYSTAQIPSFSHRSFSIKGRVKLESVPLCWMKHREDGDFQVASMIKKQWKERDGLHLAWYNSYGKKLKGSTFSRGHGCLRSLTRHWRGEYPSTSEFAISISKLPDSKSTCMCWRIVEK